MRISVFTKIAFNAIELIMMLPPRTTQLNDVIPNDIVRGTSNKLAISNLIRDLDGPFYFAVTQPKRKTYVFPGGSGRIKVQPLRDVFAALLVEFTGDFNLFTIHKLITDKLCSSEMKVYRTEIGILDRNMDFFICATLYHFILMYLIGLQCNYAPLLEPFWNELMKQ